MTYDELMLQKAEADASIVRWQQAISQCDQILADVGIKRRNAEIQVAYHKGHAERIALWLEGMKGEEQTRANTNNP
jgi:hypothetical protein